MKCPMCHQDQWIPGKLRTRAHVQFIPDQTRFLIAAYPGIAAHACGSCGHVRLEVDAGVLKSAIKE